MELLSVHTSWLIPGEKTPCDIYFYFRGSYVVALKQSTEITLDFMSKLLKTEYPLAYVAKAKEADWHAWTKERHPHLSTSEPTAPQTDKKKSLYGNKRSEFISYAQKGVIPRDNTDKTINALAEKSVAAIKKAIQGPAWDWYFDQFHEPPDLFQHSCRTTMLATLLALSSKSVTDSALEVLIQSCLIHEVEGDPAKSLNTVVSERTLKILSDEGRPIAKDVIDQIRLQDELVSGNGFPQKLKDDKVPISIRLFALVNHFDHHRIKAIGTSRRAKFDQCKKSMEARKADYDPMLWEQFWKMLSDDFEVVG